MSVTENNPASDAARLGRASWWREWEVPVLILLVIVGYFCRAGELPLRGEEPTRAQSAFEMVQSGDWVVPREQGEPFLRRPPMQYWFIALSCQALGTWNEWAVRFPSVVATLLTTLLIYGYARQWLPRLGAFAAAAAFATMADIFKMGLYAETEAVFICEVSASLLVWHWGYLRRWPEWATFGAGYALMALGLLTKSFQAPAYFVGGISVFLLLSGQWRRLFCRGHLVGIGVAAVMLLAWVLPYAAAVGWGAVPKAWFGDEVVGDSSMPWGWNLRQFAEHLLTLPLEVYAGALPWSLMLLLYLRRDFRSVIGEARPQVMFLAICMAIAFPSCWLPPKGAPRFFAPLFPAASVLIGLAIQRCAEAEAGSALRLAWRRYLLVLSPIVVGAPAAILALATIGAPLAALEPFVAPPLVAIGYAVAFAVLAVLLLRVMAAATPLQVRLGLFGTVAFLVIAFNGVVTDVRVRRSVNVADSVRLLKEQLPPGQALVSIGGHVDCLFPYYYGPPTIAVRPWPMPGKVDPDLTFFCFNCPGDIRPDLPFAWKELAAIPMDRNLQVPPERVVVVGMRLPATGTTVGAMPVSSGGR